MRRNKLHIPHPVRRLRRTGLVRSVVPPFLTRIASLDSRGNPAPLQTPLKRPRKRRFLFLGTITPPNIGDGGIFVQWLSFCLCRGRCPHRPDKNYEFAEDFRKTTHPAGTMWASSPTTLNRTNIVRLPYVKYSTGANRMICTTYRALRKPDQTAARRAFLAGRAIGEWHAETKCLFCASALFRVPASLFCILFSDKPEKSIPPEARPCCAKKNGRTANIKRLSAEAESLLLVMK